MKNASEEKEDLFALVFSELKNYGVKVPKIKKFKSSIAKQDRSSVESKSKVFGTSLSEQEWISESGIPLPKFVAATTAYLRNYVNVEIGLFRKAGSVARQRELRAKVESEIVFENCEPNDVASLLKQWLRELPEPVIPIYLHELFVKCNGVESEDDRVAALLMCCLLLPSEHLYTLKHLLKFLSDIASNSAINKMVPHNLAVVMAPNLLSCGCEKGEKSSNTRVQCYTGLVELLIINADLVGQVPPHLAAQLNLKATDSHDLLIEPLDSSPSRGRKKRRSGGMTDLVNGIRKFVGNNITPINNCMDTNAEHSKDLAPRSAPKRKADPDLHLLPNFKKRPVNESHSIHFGQNFLTPMGKSRSVHATTPANVPMNTPLSHIRRKSFGLLGKKKRKRVKSASKLNSSCKETTLLLEASKLSDNLVVDCPEANIEKTPAPQKCLLTIPTVELSPNMNLSSPSPSQERKPKIIRANSDQPLSEKQEIISRIMSTSHECLPTEKSPSGDKTDCIPKPKPSPMLEPIQFKPKAPARKRSPKVNNTLVLSSQLSPALLKKELLANVKQEKQPLQRRGSARRSSNKKARLKQDVAKRTSSSAAEPNISKNLRHTDVDITNGNDCSASVTRTSDNSTVEPTSNLNATVEEKLSIACDDSIMKTPEAKHNEKRNSLKRGGNKGSLRRGRPNTIKTGLPSDLCPKYSIDSLSLKLDIPDINASPESVKSKETSYEVDEPLEGISVILEDGVYETKKRRSLRKKESGGGNNMQQIGDPSVKEENLSSLKNRQSPAQLPTRIKIDNKENNFKELSTVTSVDSYSELQSNVKSRRSSTCANILTPAAELENNMNSAATDFEHCVTNVSLNMQTVTKSPSPETEEWRTDAEDFLNEHFLMADVPACKRESIVQIIKKNAGMVRANVHRYNRIANTTPHEDGASQSQCITPHENTVSRSCSTVSSKKLNVTPCRTASSLNKGKFSSGSRYKSQKTPLPPPPKFFVNSIEKVSSPLKEVTNTSNGKDLKVFAAASPTDKLRASPLLPKRKVKNFRTNECPKVEVKGFSNAKRAESSPSLSQAHYKRSPLAIDGKSPSRLPIHSQSFNSPHGYVNYSRPRKRASKQSLHYIDSSCSNQLVDEWQCDM